MRFRKRSHDRRPAPCRRWTRHNGCWATADLRRTFAVNARRANRWKNIVRTIRNGTGRSGNNIDFCAKNAIEWDIRYAYNYAQPTADFSPGGGAITLYRRFLRCSHGRSNKPRLDVPRDSGPMCVYVTHKFLLFFNEMFYIPYTVKRSKRNHSRFSPRPSPVLFGRYRTRADGRIRRKPFDATYTPVNTACTRGFSICTQKVIMFPNVISNGARLRSTTRNT